MHFSFLGFSRLSLRARRLVFESLERRELLSVTRLVAWNTENQPNDGTSDAYFQTILEAIGNETVAGNTKRLDILALQETDITGAGGSSIGRIEGILDALYLGTDYASVVSTEDGGGVHTRGRKRTLAKVQLTRCPEGRGTRGTSRRLTHPPMPTATPQPTDTPLVQP
jgi:hypothetical protein